MTEQLELFERSEEEKMKENVLSTRKAIDNLRRGMFERHSNLSKNVTCLQAQIEELKLQILILDKYIKSKE